MPKAGDLKKGNVVEINGQPYIAKHIDVQSPSSRGTSTLYKVRFNNAQTKQKHEQTFKGDDFLKEVDLIRRNVQFSYMDGESYVFMDTEDFTQYLLNADDLEGQVGYVTEGLEGIIAMIIDEQVLGIELPQSVGLEITDTAPALKGATASGRTKTAMLSSGIEVQVPEYLETGEVIKVNTVTGKFMSRA
jgi:elongation factor P